MEPDFPFEFIVLGTPVSLQSGNPKSREAWRKLVRDAATPHLPEMHFASDKPLTATLYYFPATVMDGDVDNIVKLTLDGMSKHIFIDDNQIERVVVQKFEPDRVFAFSAPSEMLISAMLGEKPALYVRLSTDLSEGL